jgi:hypothetical protein
MSNMGYRNALVIGDGIDNIMKKYLRTVEFVKRITFDDGENSLRKKFNEELEIFKSGITACYSSSYSYDFIKKYPYCYLPEIHDEPTHFTKQQAVIKYVKNELLPGCEFYPSRDMFTLYDNIVEDYWIAGKNNTLGMSLYIKNSCEHKYIKKAFKNHFGVGNWATYRAKVRDVEWNIVDGFVLSNQPINLNQKQILFSIIIHDNGFHRFDNVLRNTDEFNDYMTLRDSFPDETATACEVVI